MNRSTEILEKSLRIVWERLVEVRRWHSAKTLQHPRRHTRPRSVDTKNKKHDGIFTFLTAHEAVARDRTGVRDYIESKRKNPHKRDEESNPIISSKREMEIGRAG